MGGSSLYPSLDEYMGLSLTPESVAANMPVVAANPPGVGIWNNACMKYLSCAK